MVFNMLVFVCVVQIQHSNTISCYSNTDPFSLHILRNKKTFRENKITIVTISDCGNTNSIGNCFPANHKTSFFSYTETGKRNPENHSHYKHRLPLSPK